MCDARKQPNPCRGNEDPPFAKGCSFSASQRPELNRLLAIGYRLFIRASGENENVRRPEASQRVPGN
jgi:hypothetical protein